MCLEETKGGGGGDGERALGSGVVGRYVGGVVGIVENGIGGGVGRMGRVRAGAGG